MATNAPSAEPRQLSDTQREELRSKLTQKSSALKSRTLGFKVRGQTTMAAAPVARIPTSLEDAELSVCGVKGFMLDEVREFETPNGPRVADCAHVAALEIVDSPFHVHGVTHEIYQVLEGKGKMVLNDEIVEVQAGSVVTLPPGVMHGLLSDDPKVPVKVFLTFTPGLASAITHPEFRDEEIICERTSTRIKELLQKTHEAVATV